MKIEGEFTFQGNRAQVWDAILDPSILGNALPGVQKMEKISDKEYDAAMEIHIGPLTGLFTGKVVLEDVVEHESYTMIVEGKGAPGFAKGTAKIQFSEQGDNTTLMKYNAELQVGGRLASVGQRLLDTVGKSMTRQSLENVNLALQKRLAGDSAGQVAPPSQAKFALDVFKGFLGESPLVFIGSIIAALVLIALAIWAAISVK